MEYVNILCQFVRGDLPNEKFEKYICDNQLIESNIGNELYQSLIKENFKDRNAVTDIKSVINNFLLNNHPPKCKCCFIRNLDRSGFGSDFSENIFLHLKKTKDKGKKYWWISLYECNTCHQGWLVAQDENYDDFYFMRLDSVKIQDIESNNWPIIFDNYNSLSTIVSTSSRFSDY
ncbi:hypothetical protein [uncultured Gammaproteobacteria bacterium]|jgi:hypothetical protein|nr:hypothetical protein [uncultured Gammaproteobacteria bacterium]CAC9556250.1 hypothetical protein [uncultured Gammaproteobacteria bacterium]